MTPSLMMDQLQAYLQQITEGMSLGPEQLRPNVYKVDLPARATPDYDPVSQNTDIAPVETTIAPGRDERWPYIIVFFLNSEENEEGYRTADIDLIFGCVGNGSGGYMDVLHLMEHVRIHLLRETWEGWSFRLSRPLSLGFYEEQADPYWTGYLSTTWEMPSIEQEVWKNGY
ncbi:hypothetical protein JJQ72_06255 [Paenibacillus sp. F411]|uniref:hypothetical protein n=1 Tax=Paenibacillus sp. F411 TaxID=2820239 RepID=UPI001AAF60B2|nr:hypothetical protein [Paenibacillus sp. F411]MBO2943579.1 hypothetical protein [Paenibacillus sp. F411]